MDAHWYINMEIDNKKSLFMATLIYDCETTNDLELMEN